MDRGSARCRWLLLCVVSLIWTASSGGSRVAAQRPPNFVIVYADDMGYTDIGPFSARTGAARPARRTSTGWPPKGVRFTDFYVAQAVCSASRMALLTGCYPNRVGIQGALEPHRDVRHQRRREDDRRGAEAARLRDGHLRQVAPRARAAVPADAGTASTSTSACRTRTTCGRAIRSRRTSTPTCRSSRNDTVVKLDPDQSQLTTRYTEHAVKFIERNARRPFFLYVAHSMPHVPLFVSRQVQGQDARRAVRRRDRGDRLVGRADPRRR